MKPVGQASRPRLSLPLSPPKWLGCEAYPPPLDNTTMTWYTSLMMGKNPLLACCPTNQRLAENVCFATAKGGPDHERCDDAFW